MNRVLSSFVKPEGANEWRRNWVIVMAAVAGVALNSIHSYSIGIMIAPLEAEFSWTRAQITFGLLIVSFVVFPLAPFMGLAIDRFGPRRIALFGVLFYCIALATLSLTSQKLWTWWLLWVVLALASLFIKPTVWVTAISSLFDSSRGLAIAIAFSATGLSAFATPLITYFLVENYGWRMAYIVWGVGSALIVVPLIYFFFSSAKDKDRSSTKIEASVVRKALTGLTVREGLKTPSFYKLSIATLILTVCNVGLAINLVPILTLSGIPRGGAAAVAGLVGISQIIGRLAGGALLDVLNARYVAATVTLFPLVTCLFLLGLPGSIAAATIAAIILGLAAGAELDVVAYLSGRYVGMRNMGTFFGVITGLFTLGVGVGPVAASYVYDVTHSYNLVLWCVIPLSLLTSSIFLILGPYPNFEEEEAGLDATP